MEEKREWNNQMSIRVMILLVLIAVMITSINGCGYLGLFGHATWREEVLLHDGSKIIVKRWQKRINVYTLEKSSLIQRQSLSFKHPVTKEKIVWKDGPTEGIRTVNFTLIALHIKNNTPYIITQTYGCFAYNRWGRPNPPYVIFKYEDERWQHIPLEELPLEFKNVNLIMGIDKLAEKEILKGPNLITAEMVKRLNDRYPAAIFKSIVRIPLKESGQDDCPEMIYDGRGGWKGIDYFNTKNSFEACLDECKKVLFDLQYCPCSRFFNNITKGE